MTPESRKLAVKCRNLAPAVASDLLLKEITKGNRELVIEVLSLIDNLPTSQFEEILDSDPVLGDLYWRG